MCVACMHTVDIPGGRIEPALRMDPGPLAGRRCHCRGAAAAPSSAADATLSSHMHALVLPGGRHNSTMSQ